MCAPRLSRAWSWMWSPSAQASIKSSMSSASACTSIDMFTKLSGPSMSPRFCCSGLTTLTTDSCSSCPLPQHPANIGARERESAALCAGRAQTIAPRGRGAWRFLSRGRLCLRDQPAAWRNPSAFVAKEHVRIERGNLNCRRQLCTIRDASAGDADGGNHGATSAAAAAAPHSSVSPRPRRAIFSAAKATNRMARNRCRLALLLVIVAAGLHGRRGAVRVHRLSLRRSTVRNAGGFQRR